MIIHNVTRELHDAIVKCEVHNDVGKSEETETLDVTCKLQLYFYSECIKRAFAKSGLLNFPLI